MVEMPSRKVLGKAAFTSNPDSRLLTIFLKRICWTQFMIILAKALAWTDEMAPGSDDDFPLSRPAGQQLIQAAHGQKLPVKLMAALVSMRPDLGM